MDSKPGKAGVSLPAIAGAAAGGLVAILVGMLWVLIAVEVADIAIIHAMHIDVFVLLCVYT